MALTSVGGWVGRALSGRTRVIQIGKKNSRNLVFTLRSMGLMHISEFPLSPSVHPHYQVVRWDLTMAPSLRYIKKTHCSSHVSCLTSRPILHKVTCSPLFAFSQAGMCGVRTSRVQTGSPIMNQAPHRPIDGQPSFRNTKVAATPMADQGKVLPFPRDRYVQTGLEGLQTCPRFCHQEPLSEWPSAQPNPLNYIRARYAELVKGV